MTCMAIMSSLLYRYRTVSFQSGFSNNYLDQTFLGDRRNISVVNEETACYSGKGIDDVMNGIELNIYARGEKALIIIFLQQEAASLFLMKI